MQNPMLTKPTIEGRFVHLALLQGVCPLHLSRVPCFNDSQEVLEGCFFRSAKMNTPRSGDGGAYPVQRTEKEKPC